MKVAAAMIGALALGAAGLAIAAEASNPDAQIKFRKNVMKAVGGTAGGMGAILKGDVEGKDQLAALSQSLLAVTDPTLLEAAFRPNTDGKGSEKTTASGKIWTDWDGYLKKTTDFRVQVEKVAAKGNDVDFNDMKALFGTCKACHDGYRVR